MWLLAKIVVVGSLLCLVKTDCPVVVSRKEWDALDPVRVNYVERPVSTVIIIHTVSPPCTTDEACITSVQSLQGYHMDQLNYWDIGSSFYVGGNGKLYEGSGWIRSSSHIPGYNDNAIQIAFLGNYNTIKPTNDQINAVKDLIKCGVEEGHIASDYHVVGHRQLVATESPGRKLYNIIRSWPEWLEDVSSIKKEESKS